MWVWVVGSCVESVCICVGGGTLGGWGVCRKSICVTCVCVTCVYRKYLCDVHVYVCEESICDVCVRG